MKQTNKRSHLTSCVWIVILERQCSHLCFDCFLIGKWIAYLHWTALAASFVSETATSGCSQVWDCRIDLKGGREQFLTHRPLKHKVGSKYILLLLGDGHWLQPGLGLSYCSERRKGTITDTQTAWTQGRIKIHTGHSPHLKLKSDVIIKHTSHGYLH